MQHAIYRVILPLVASAFMLLLAPNRGVPIERLAVPAPTPTPTPAPTPTPTPRSNVAECGECANSSECHAGATCANSKCVTPMTLNFGAYCCNSQQCKKGICRNSSCQCNDDSQCDVGQYCDKGFFGIGTNKCLDTKTECQRCEGDKECLAPLICKGQPLGKCIDPNAPKRLLGGTCCKDAQCQSGSCNEKKLQCQCHDDKDCGDPGLYCDKGGAFGAGLNKCQPLVRECGGCRHDYECASGKCKGEVIAGIFQGKCITVGSVGLGGVCCKDKQCTTGSCNNSSLVCQCTDSNQCPPAGQYCDLGGSLGAGPNKCKLLVGECGGCFHDYECASGKCKDEVTGVIPGKCITVGSVGIGGTCCKEAQCTTGSCNANHVCQCTHSNQCPAGQYCDIGLFGAGLNTCKPPVGECGDCFGDKECGPGHECRNFKCIMPYSVKSNEKCCRDRQCISGKCKFSRDPDTCQ